MSFTVFLGNLPVWVTADDIKGWLTAENLVADAIKVIRNPETQESKGFAFIDAPNTEEMNAIIRRFDRAPLEDRLLRANPAQPPRPKSQGPAGRPMGSGPGAGYGSSGHGSSGHSSVFSQGSVSRQGTVSRQGSGVGQGSGFGQGSGQGSATMQASPSGQAPASGQTSPAGQGPAAGSGSAGSSATSSSTTGGGDIRPPRRKKGSAKRTPAGGPQSPFAEELAKAL
jgi:hypothetical protein